MSRWTGGIGPLDEYPLHQAPLPVAWAAAATATSTTAPTSTPTTAPATSSCIFGHGYYPNLGTKDAFFLVRRGDTQTAVHFGDAIDDDRLNQHVGNYRIEVLEPLQKLRVVARGDRGHRRGPDLGGHLFAVLQEQPHVHALRVAGSPSTRSGSPSSARGAAPIVVDGEEIAVDPGPLDRLRDRSWGIRPVGEARAGRVLRRTRRSRACGGSTCRCLRRLRRRA